MRRSEFRRLVARGHGRAVLWVGEHSDTDVPKFIEEACLNELRWDRQCEEGRGWYVAELIARTLDPQHYIGLVSSSVTERCSERNHEHRVSVALELAKRGYEAPRTTIEENWRGCLSKRSLALADAWIELEKARAYREVLHEMGKRWRRKKTPVCDAFGLHITAKYEVGTKTAARMRRTAARKWPGLVSIGDFPEGYPKPRSDPREARVEEAVKAGVTAETLVEMSSTYADRMLLPAELVKNLSEAELVRVGEALSAAKEPVLIRHLIRVFCRRVYPLDPDGLIRFTESEVRRIRHFAFRALERVGHPKVREFGLACLESEKDIGYGFGMFIQNYQKGDAATLLERARRLREPGEMHIAGLDLQSIAEKNSCPETDELVKHVLESTNCSACRSYAFRWLKRRRAISDSSANEGLFDADSSTRDMARELCRRRKI